MSRGFARPSWARRQVGIRGRRDDGGARRGVRADLVRYEGNTGRLFSEFALALAGAVVLSTLVALTLSPAMCAVMLRRGKSLAG